MFVGYQESHQRIYKVVRKTRFFVTTMSDESQLPKRSDFPPGAEFVIKEFDVPLVQLPDGVWFNWFGGMPQPYNASSLRVEFHTYLQALVRAGFGKRIMFGSDQMIWPEAIGMAIEGVESAKFLTRAQKRDIFYNNAVKFFRLDKK